MQVSFLKNLSKQERHGYTPKSNHKAFTVADRYCNFPTFMNNRMKPSKLFIKILFFTYYFDFGFQDYWCYPFLCYFFILFIILTYFINSNHIFLSLTPFIYINWSNEINFLVKLQIYVFFFFKNIDLKEDKKFIVVKVSKLTCMCSIMSF